MSVTGVLLDPKRFAVHDGPGVRTTFFLKGCPLKCIWCHNPESISPRPQMAYYAHKCIGCGECVTCCPEKAHTFRGETHEFDPSRCRVCGACEAACLGGAMKLYGKRIPVEEAMETARLDLVYYRESQGGVTLSGGEPLMQPEFSLAFLEALKREKIHTAFDTSCFGSQEVLKEALSLVDLFLVDFKHADPEVHRKLTGQSNERILENLRFLSEKGARIEIRIPFVPGCNDSVENLEATGRILGSLRGILCVKLLPYHALARTKYASLGMPDTMPQADSPDDDALHRAAAVLERFGLRARSGRE